MTSAQIGVRGSLARRSDFPLLDRVAYLDQAAIGLVPEPVRRAAREFEDSVMLGGTTVLADEDEAHILDGSRGAIANLLGTSPEDIAIVTSATEALCQFAWWLYPGPSENIVSLDTEFPSVTYPWLRLQQSTGVEVRLAEAMALRRAEEVYEAIASVMDSKTTVLCVSQVHYASGAKLDLARLGELARAHGAYLIIDGTQGVGASSLDVSAAQVDVLVASSHKWLCAPHGAAACYLAPHIREQFVPPFVGWRSNKVSADFDPRRFEIWDDARCMEFGTTSYAAGIALGAGVDYLLALGIERIEQHSSRLLQRLELGLDSLNIATITPRDPSERAGILTVSLPDVNSLEIAKALALRGVVMSSRLGGVRLSAHVFNDESDIDRALFALDEALSQERGRR